MLALAVFEERISSIFDNSNQLILVSQEGQYSKQSRMNINTACIEGLIEDLKRAEINILICGAISGCLQRIIESHGIQVLPWISGRVDDVLSAYQNGDLINFVMPGCRSCRRNVSREQSIVKGGIKMPGNRGSVFGQGVNAGKKGMGQGRGQGRGQGKKCFSGQSKGFTQNCVCPQCGITVPHQRQVPCTSMRCPQCGSVMVREDRT
ncbi:MAG: NifB/NifX family molybdenum-iron cluster-binding protein [Bacillota bacterium]